jgi:sulfur carrier protein ThiS
MSSDEGDFVNNVEVISVGGLGPRLGSEDRLRVGADGSVQTMLAGLNLDPGSTMVMVNGRRVAKEYALRCGDEVRLLRLITGG